MGVSATWRKDRGRWQVTARRSGEKKTKLAPKGMGKREAIAVVGDALIAQIEAAQTPQPNSALPPTLWDFCIGVYTDSHGVADSTWRRRKYKVAGLMEDLGNLRLDQITTSVVTEWLELLQTDGAPLKRGGRGKPLASGGSTLNDYIVVLMAIFRIAYDKHYINAIPFRVRLKSLDLSTDREAWTPAMKQRLIEASAADDPLMLRLASFLMLTGCRPVEALRLRWDQVQDVPAPNVTITGKGHRFRKLPLSGALGKFVAELPHAGRAVFPVENGPTTGEPYKFWPQRRWERVCAAAQVPSVVYDLRHTFITEMIVKGASLPEIAKWCGNSVRVIEARYAHLTPEFLSGVASKVEAPAPSPAPAPDQAETSSDSSSN